MPVKTLRLRQGENFFELAERKFGNRNIGNALIRQFGQGRSGVQYRFRTNLSTSKKAVAGRRSQIAADFAQQQELVTPEIVGEPLLTRPEDIQGREAQMARIEQRVLGTPGGAVTPRLKGRAAQLAAIDARVAETMGGFGLSEQQRRGQQIETRTQRALGLGPATGTAGLGEGVTQLDILSGLAKELGRGDAQVQDGEIRPEVGLENITPASLFASFTDRISVLPTSHPAGLNVGQVKDLAVGLIDKLRLGETPSVIADATARTAFGEGFEAILLSVGYIFNEATGFWEFNSGVATGPGTGGTGIGGGFFGGGRRVGGGGGGAVVERRNIGFAPSGSNLFNWRVNFG